MEVPRVECNGMRRDVSRPRRPNVGKELKSKSEIPRKGK
jgi:hypothetical protein